MTRQARAGTPQPFTRWGPPRPAPAEPLSAASRPAAQGQADGLIRPSGRIPAGGDTQSIIMSPGQRQAPRTQVRLAAPCPAPLPPRPVTPAQERHAPEPLTTSATQDLPAPCRLASSAPGRPRQGRLRRRASPRGRYAPLDPPARSQDPAAIRGQGAGSGIPRSGNPEATDPISPLAGCGPIQVRRLLARRPRECQSRSAIGGGRCSGASTAASPRDREPGLRAPVYVPSRSCPTSRTSTRLRSPSARPCQYVLRIR